MTIKWVKVDPLVMRGEPFCYGTRLTVRQLLELRRNGYDLPNLLREHPELRRVGIAQAYRYAGEHRERYREFFERDGSLVGPGLTTGDRGCQGSRSGTSGSAFLTASGAGRAADRLFR